MIYISANRWRNELYGIDENGLTYEMIDITKPIWKQIDLGIKEKPTAIISNDTSKLIAVKGVKVYLHKSDTLSLVMTNPSPEYEIKHMSWTSNCLVLTYHDNTRHYTTSIIARAYGFRADIGHYHQVSCIETHCWGAHTQVLAYSSNGASCNIRRIHNYDRNKDGKKSYISVAMTETEVWAIHLGGRKIARQLGKVSAKDWFDFPLLLPEPAKWITIGKMGTFVLLTSGKVAVFQGKSYSILNTICDPKTLKSASFQSYWVAISCPYLKF